MSAKSTFSHLVVVGSSAGGVEALSGLVANLPNGLQAPIVVAQHLDPDRASHLEQILSRRSTLPVRTVSEHETLEAGVIFVVPANRQVNVTDSEIDLRTIEGMGRPRGSNLLFSSAANSFGERLIAVILSGTGSDGTEGARVVSRAGGTVIIQDPETAEFGDMPGSLAPNTVDIVAELDRIGPVLGNLVSGAGVPERVPQEDEKRALEGFLEELRDRHGIDFSSYKMPTIMRRLRRRMVAIESGSIEELNTTNDDLQARTSELQVLARISEEERGRLRAILESIPEAVLVVDAAGRTMLTNAAYGRLFGGSDFEALDDLGDTLGPDETLQTRVAGGESCSVEFFAVTQDGTRRHFRAEGSPIGANDGRGGVIVIHEIEDE